MKKIVVTCPAPSIISLDEANLDSGLIVCVYKSEVSILTEYNSTGPCKYAFLKTGYNFHSASPTKKEAIEKNIHSAESEIFQFDNWTEFFTAFQKNGWR